MLLRAGDYCSFCVEEKNSGGERISIYFLSKYFYTSIEPKCILVGFEFESNMKALNNEIN